MRTSLRPIGPFHAPASTDGPEVVRDARPRGGPPRGVATGPAARCSAAGTLAPRKALHHEASTGLPLKWPAADLSAITASANAALARRGRSTAPPLPAASVASATGHSVAVEQPPATPLRSLSFESQASTLVHSIPSPTLTTAETLAAEQAFEPLSPALKLRPAANQKTVAPLDDEQLLSRLGKRADEASQALNRMDGRMRELAGQARLPALMKYRAQAAAGHSPGLAETLRCLDAYAEDLEGELYGASTFAGTRLNLAMQLRRPLFRPYKDREALLGALTEAEAMFNTRTRLDRGMDGRFVGEIMCSRSKALANSLAIGFKAEPGAAATREHPLWRLAEELGVPLDAAGPA